MHLVGVYTYCRMMHGVYNVKQNRLFKLYINRLQPSGCCLYHYFCHSKILHSSRSLCMFCVDLRTNIEFCPLQHSVNGFYNRAGKCLVRVTNWVFKYKGLRLVLKGFKIIALVSWLITHFQHLCKTLEYSQSLM